MKLSLQRLSQDWQDHYHHPVLVVESFVDPQQFSGTCYKASGWTLLGHTQGAAPARISTSPTTAPNNSGYANSNPARAPSCVGATNPRPSAPPPPRIPRNAWKLPQNSSK